jgi:hypothetical protein
VPSALRPTASAFSTCACILLSSMSCGLFAYFLDVAHPPCDSEPRIRTDWICPITNK